MMSVIALSATLLDMSNASTASPAPKIAHQTDSQCAILACNSVQSGSRDAVISSES